MAKLVYPSQRGLARPDSIVRVVSTGPHRQSAMGTLELAGYVQLGIFVILAPKYRHHVLQARLDPPMAPVLLLIARYAWKENIARRQDSRNRVEIVRLDSIVSMEARRHIPVVLGGMNVRSVSTVHLEPYCQ